MVISPAGAQGETIAEPSHVVGHLLGAAVVAAFAVVAFALALRSLGWPLVHDAPIMHYLAWRIADGAVPYRDLFDMNFPGTYLIHLAVITGLGPGDAAWRAFDLGWLALTAGSIAALAAPWGTVAAAGGGAFFAAYHLASGAWQAGQRDFLLCPFLVLGALAVARWLEGRGGVAGLAWGGLALGAGVTVKPQALALAGGLAALVVVGAWRAGVAPGRPLAAWVAATAVPSLAMVSWLGAAGALPAWRAIVTDYLLPLYSGVGRPAAWGYHRWQVWIPIALVIAAGVAGAAAGRRLRARHVVALVGLIYGIAHYVGQGKGWEYHAYPAAAFAATLLGSDMAVAACRPWRALPVGAALIAVAVMLWTKGVEAADAGWVREKTARVDAVVAGLASRLGPHDRVQVLDTTEGGVHALLRLRARQPSRFVYDFHFFHDADHPVIQALRAELIRDLDARPPRYVVVFDRGWPAGGADRIARFPALADRLAHRYRLLARGDGYVIHAQRDRP
jgi:hypothetical protein